MYRRISIMKDDCFEKIMELWGQKLDAAGKRDGITQAKTYDEILDEHPEWFEKDGYAKQEDIDLAIGNMREDGKKILNTQELFRQQNGEQHDAT